MKSISMMFMKEVMRLVGCGVDKDNNGGGIKGGIEV